MVQADDARAFLAHKIEQAADEITRQAGRIRSGLPYQGRSVAVRMAAIDEAREILEALDTNVARLLKAGAVA
jgi:hypothetical protein